jgi:hypothetical protein
MRRFAAQFLMIVLLATSIATAQSSTEIPGASGGVVIDPHPALSPNGTWVGILVIVIVGLFVMAAVIAPIVQANLSEEIPPTHSYDEPPGTSGHHGASGTIRR